MADAIERTKQEIAEIKAETDDGNRFVQASNELDAIVTQTESATGEILGAAEKIQELAWTLREEGASSDTCDQLDEHATNIYMACSFQDLTGQRTRKVVQVLKYLESRVHAMIDIWGLEEVRAASRAPTNPTDTRPDAHLLNGPQLAGRGVSQSAVDDLFDPAASLIVDAEPAPTTHMSNDAVDALFDQVEMDAIEIDVIDDEPAAVEPERIDEDTLASIVDDIEIIAPETIDAVDAAGDDVFGARSDEPETMDDEAPIALGEPATAPIPDEPLEMMASGDVFAPSEPLPVPSTPMVDVEDVAADVFAPAPFEPAPGQPALVQPSIIAVGATLRIAEVAPLASASPSPLMAVEAAVDPLEAMTPAMRLNLMG
jgi:hypothetical protein